MTERGGTGALPRPLGPAPDVPPGRLLGGGVRRAEPRQRARTPVGLRHRLHAERRGAGRGGRRPDVRHHRRLHEAVPGRRGRLLDGGVRQPGTRRRRTRPPRAPGASRRSGSGCSGWSAARWARCSCAAAERYSAAAFRRRRSAIPASASKTIRCAAFTVRSLTSYAGAHLDDVHPDDVVLQGELADHPEQVDAGHPAGLGGAGARCVRGIHHVDVDRQVEVVGLRQRLGDRVGHHRLEAALPDLVHGVPDHALLAHPGEGLRRRPVAAQPDLDEAVARAPRRTRSAGASGCRGWPGCRRCGRRCPRGRRSARSRRCRGRARRRPRWPRAR